LSIVLILNLFI